MEAEKLAKQMIGFQKTAFNHTFDMVMAVRDQSEKITCSWCEKNGILPDQSKKVMLEWGHVIKKNLEEYKKVINDGFNTIESCFDFSKTGSQPKTSPVDKKTTEKKQPENQSAPAGEKQ
jgi:hypothetical protein